MESELSSENIINYYNINRSFFRKKDLNVEIIGPPPLTLYNFTGRKCVLEIEYLRKYFYVNEIDVYTAIQIFIYLLHIWIKNY